MAPIRTAVIGLSASAATSWASSAHLPYLLSPRGRAKYEIVALCNSSVDAAKKAVAHYKLPPGTATYGDPVSLARDPNVELVVCNTRVDKHHETIRPSIEAGKAVYCEWPLAQDIEHVKDLVDLAREKGGKTMIGMQGRVTPIVLKLRSLLEQGRIGKVLSSEVRVNGGTNDRVVLPDMISYFAQRKVGGNILTIYLGHVWDYVQSVVGEVTNVQPHLQLQRPDVKVRDPATNTIKEVIKSDVPDLIITTGRLEASSVAQEGATVLFRLRRGQPFPGEAPLVWTINGEKGEIRLTSPAGAALQAAAYAQPPIVELHDFETDTVQKVEWGWADWQEDLPAVARNVGGLYEAFADGDASGYPTFEDALQRHEQLETVWSGWQ